MKHISIRLPEQLYESVTQRASDLGLSVSECIRTLVAQACSLKRTITSTQSIHEKTSEHVGESRYRSPEGSALHVMLINVVDTFTNLGYPL